MSFSNSNDYGTFTFRGFTVSIEEDPLVYKGSIYRIFNSNNQQCLQTFDPKDVVQFLLSINRISAFLINETTEGDMDTPLNQQNSLERLKSALKDVFGFQPSKNNLSNE